MAFGRFYGITQRLGYASLDAALGANRNAAGQPEDTVCHSGDVALRMTPDAVPALTLHGHSHGRLRSSPRQVEVGLDAWDCRPATLATIRSA